MTSTVLPTSVAYVAHWYWSSSHRARIRVAREHLRFALINRTTLLPGLAVTALARCPFGQEGALVLQMTNIGSIAVGTVPRYLSYRRWVIPTEPGASGP